jgi:hypothetical protein
MLLVAAGASLATAATRVADPEFRASIKDGFTKGEFDADFWENSVGVVGDLAGAVPGLGAVTRGANGAIRSAIHGGEAAAGMKAFFTQFGDDTVTAATRISTAGSYNPVGDWVAHAAGGSQAVRVGMDYVSPVAGVFTSGYGLAADNIEALDGDAGKNTSTAVDGARAGVFDGPGAVSTVVNTLRVVTR